MSATLNLRRAKKNIEQREFRRPRAFTLGPAFFASSCDDPDCPDCSDERVTVQ